MSHQLNHGVTKYFNYRHKSCVGQIVNFGCLGSFGCIIHFGHNGNFGHLSDFGCIIHFGHNGNLGHLSDLGCITYSNELIYTPPNNFHLTME
jgi:hypothetical protein